MSHAAEKLSKIHIDKNALDLEIRSSFAKAILSYVLVVKTTLQWVEMTQRDGILNTVEGSGLRRRNIYS